MLPTTLSLTEMLVSVTLPQLVTAPLMVCGWPTTAVVQVFVTVMHGLCVTAHTFVESAETGVPQMLTPETPTMLVVLTQSAVKVRLKVKVPPGGKVPTFVMVMGAVGTNSVTMMLVSVTLPQLVTEPLMVCGWPAMAGVQVLVMPTHGLSVVTQVLVALADTGVPHGKLTAEAVTILVLPPQ